MACAVALGSCTTWRDEVISGFCGARNDDHPRWVRIEPPADSDTYRTLARADASVTPPRDGKEYWFALTSGEIKYCISPLRYSMTIAERNGSGCDDRVGIWWVFRQTPSGPVTDGIVERVCIT